MMRGPKGLNEVWTGQRIERLRDLWGKGMTASQIVEQLGGGLTRNAVVGKAHRLGLTGRPSPIVRDGRTPKRLSAKGRPPAQVKKIVVAGPVGKVEAAPGVAVELRREPPPPPPPLRASNRSCAWPIGDPREAGFHFCGATPVAEGRSYCDEHHARAFQRRTAPAAATMPAFVNYEARKWAR